MKKICIITLGCKVNQYESDALGERLEKEGNIITHKLEYADIYILNSCAVTNEAEKKSRQTIAKFNKLNPDCQIYIFGCASQNNPEQFVKLKNVKYVQGNANTYSLISKIKLGRKGFKLEDFADIYNEINITKSSNTRAHIKIQDGCNNFCSYCLIPYLRGRSRSRDMFEILKEVNSLKQNGVKEIVITGIDISDYRIDEKNALLDLLIEIDKFGVRYRLGSIEPTLLTNEFVLGIKKLKNLCPHFHISMQSGCTKTLARMNRHYTAKFYIERVNLLRKYFKDCAITTDIIVGFPGETEQEFAETVATVKRIQFAHTHIFPYSRRSGTLADKMLKLKTNDQYFEIDGITAKARVKTLLELNKKYSQKFLNSQKHKILEVVIEEKNGTYYSGTSSNYVKVYVKSEKNILNQIVNIKIIGKYEDGVIGEII